ncbi:hypothetical protein D3C76_1168270 [compost metagenome]
MGGQDIQRHHRLVVAHRHHGPWAAVGGGAEGQLAPAQQPGNEDVQHRVLVHAGTQVVQQFPIVALAQAGQLQVIAAEEGTGATGGAAAQQGAGHHAVGAGLHFAGGELLQAGAQAGTQQARPLDHGAGQGHHAFDPEPAAGEQLADGDHVLVTDVPDALARAHRIEEMDMGAGQSCRVRPGEGFSLDLGQPLARQADAFGLAEEDTRQAG